MRLPGRSKEPGERQRARRSFRGRAAMPSSPLSGAVSDGSARALLAGSRESVGRPGSRAVLRGLLATALRPRPAMDLAHAMEGREIGGSNGVWQTPNRVSGAAPNLVIALPRRVAALCPTLKRNSNPAWRGENRRSHYEVPPFPPCRTSSRAIVTVRLLTGNRRGRLVEMSDRLQISSR